MPRPPDIHAFEELMSNMEIPSHEIRRLLPQLEAIAAGGATPKI
jgi:hypothetical protein